MGLTLKELARDSGVSRSSLSRLETGQQLPGRENREVTLARILTALHVTGDEFHELMDLARRAQEQVNWVAADARESPRQLLTLIDYEEVATSIAVVTLALMPGLLQTPEYARALYVAGDVPAAEIDGRVKVRMNRQEVLDREVQFLTIIDESVLDRPFGGPDVAARQLRHMVTMAQRPNITIQVMPYDQGGLAVLNSGYLLMEFAKQPPVAHVEHLLGGTFLDQGEAVRRLVEKTAKLRERALDPDTSIELIQQIANTLESQ